MNRRALESMRARVRAVRARANVRRWTYRQRNLAAGVWFRLRRVLADAQAAYEIPEHEARRLVSEGFQPEPCGREVAPEKTILFIDEARICEIATRRRIPVRLGHDFLAARAIALVPFDESR